MNSTDKKETRHLLFYTGPNSFIEEHLRPTGFHYSVRITEWFKATKGEIQASPSLIYESQSKDVLEAIKKALVATDKYKSESFLIISLP